MTHTSLRSHRCGELRAEHVGEEVRLGGWIHRRRDLGGIVFFDLRDRDGLVQVAFGPDWCSPDVVKKAGSLGHENVVLIDGVVIARPSDAANMELSTGEIEVRARSLELVGPSGPPAIPVWRAKGEDVPSEELRLEHRFLDLRRPEMQRNMVLRHRLLQCSRRELSEQGFLEIETPILTKPTPEGARDYLVPSRVHAGQFYALPQSPQIYKQVLMASGFDRYFQIARCFRDEDLRADRQPEFTQIDIEASFVTAADVYDSIERLTVALWREAGCTVESPFPRLTYADAMERFGTDKPDLRFAVEIEDVTGWLADRGFAAFDEVVVRGDRLRGIRVPSGAALSRRQTDAVVELAKRQGLRGLALLKRRGAELSGPLAKLRGMSLEDARLNDGDLWLVAAGDDGTTSPALDAVRRAVIAELGITPTSQYAFAWVDAFPLFEFDADVGTWTFAHHPFTAPAEEDRERFLGGETADIRSQHYDLVYNGFELGSGSIRISDPDLQLAVLRYLGLSPEESQHRFGFLLDALRGGTPPHGGMALGFDRIVMLLAGADNLRDVIAFPKTTAARALFEDAPTTVTHDELARLALQVTA